MKAGTQLASAQSWSLKLEQGHVLSMLKTKVEVLLGIAAHLTQVVFDREPGSVSLTEML